MSRRGAGPRLWKHRYVVGATTAAASSRCVWEDERPSGTPDERGTLMVLGAHERRRTYVVGAAVKDVVARVIRYRCYEVDPRAESSAIGHADIVSAVRRAPRQVATLLRQLLGSPYAVCMAIGAVAPEVSDPPEGAG